MLLDILNITLLVLGFGFVIFWHELGHFLAAKWVGIEVEQFAVGMGHAVVAWRKGLGFRVGTTRKEYERRIREHLSKSKGGTGDADAVSAKEANDAVANLSPAERRRLAGEVGLGETEYRLNWMPIGGYVKMLGQDDLDPTATVDDPRAYHKQSVGARMIVVSAGVIMNIILAGILFMVLFTMGFRVPPAVVGGVAPNSPAQNLIRISDDVRASLQAGDRFLTFDGKGDLDWTKIGLNVALSGAGERVPIRVRHADGTEADYYITPSADDELSAGFLSLGIEGPRDLAGPDANKELVENWEELNPPSAGTIRPGDVITHVNGQELDLQPYPQDYEAYPRDWALFNEALQTGRTVALTVQDKDGNPREEQVRPQFARPFGREPFNLLGMVPGTRVMGLDPKSPARGKLLPGDAVLKITVAGDPTPNPSRNRFIDVVGGAGKQGEQIEIVVLRGDQEVTLQLDPTFKIAKGKRGVGVAPEPDDRRPVVAEILENSPARAAGIPAGARFTAVNGQPVEDWLDLFLQLRQAVGSATAAEAGGQERSVTVTLTLQTAGGEVQKEVTLGPEAIAQLEAVRFAPPYLALRERIEVRRASNPLQAAWWGVTETRDFILQFYVTIRRMIDGSVSPTNLMGPVGIFQAGRTFAFKGYDWLIWFLAMISANLAVVNFLPIPIVDGGLFTFLLIEKIQGRPPSPRIQSIAQVIGMAFLLGVFLFVTYNDITR